MTTVTRPEVEQLARDLPIDRASPAVTAYRDRVRGLLGTHAVPALDQAERERSFPRGVVRRLGATGLFRERWEGGPNGSVGRSVLLAEEMGRAGLGGVGVGLSLHLEAATGLLRRYARTPYAATVLDRCLAGEYVACVATSEEHVGSDLADVRTELRRDGTGWRVSGTKWFVSPGAAADVLVVLCRAEDGPALVLVPREGAVVLKRLQTMGMRSLETARMRIDCTVGDEAVLVRPGLGLAALAWGLRNERLSVAALILGSARLALALATARMRRRRQFGVPLHEHQALRLRVAELTAQVEVARRGLYSTVAELAAGGPITLCDVAGLKVTTARLGERVVSECMHIFGGEGYLEDETPLPRLLRDLRVGRVGGGTDEMMLELVASGLPDDRETYDHWIGR
ncbi:acyl-CoA dehydrogenase family protein [Actinomadura terrae]|uniref:acyl-CoA dehydrogenase family protein n=1 Tax=Actinomadura terrae TaxID=604353 RepID=UPI001FA7C607|nr:acyl-CoA dehydrogenase family protein [Actinomadura terrae]